MSGREIFKDTAKAVSATAISTALGPAGSLVAPTVNKTIVDPLADKAVHATENMSEDIPRSNSMSDIFTKKVASRKYAWRFIFVIFVMFLIFFVTYFMHSPESFGLEKDMKSSDKFVNGVYFWGTISSTVGLGDLCPRTNKAKLLVVAYEMFLLVVGIGFVLNIKDRHVDKHFDNIKRTVSRRNAFAAPSE